MGLGGFTRDSIVGLNNLVHDDDDADQSAPYRRHSGDNLRGSWNKGSSNTKDSDDLSAAMPLSESQASFETSLNDGMSPASLPVPASPSRNNRTTGYSKVSATNSRSLDSYRYDDPSGKNGAQAAHYQGFQYEGYTDFYSDAYNDDYSYSAGSGGGENKSIFCCLLAPWAQPKVIESEDQDHDDVKETGALPCPDKTAGLESSASAPDHNSAVPALTPSSSLTKQKPTVESLGTDAMPGPSVPFQHPQEAGTSNAPQPTKEVSKSTASSFNAEKPTAPHLLSGDSSDLTSGDMSLSISDEKKQEEGDVAGNEVSAEVAGEEDNGPLPTKSILKVKRCSVSIKNISNRNSVKRVSNGTTQPSSSPNMRHLFPSYNAKNSHSPDAERKGKAINFNPMARVLTIPSRKDISFHQKAQVWWQKCDYDEFKKTGRIISKAMECGGSEIWLASSNAWGNRAARSNKQKMKEETLKNGDLEEYNKALSQYVKNEEEKEEVNGPDSTGEKWWCKFGHSRRGLEHIASSSEGRARQQAVLLAIRMVMEEQKRQRLTRTKDPNKLRNVAMQYTSWARDLSLAAGSADQEAVERNFDPSATCRARHFAKRLGSLNRNHGVTVAVTSKILDANTHSSTKGRDKFNAKSLKDMNVDLNSSRGSLSRRAKGYIPGGAKDVVAM